MELLADTLFTQTALCSLDMFSKIVAVMRVLCYRI